MIKLKDGDKCPKCKDGKVYEGIANGSLVCLLCHYEISLTECDSSD